MIDVFSGCGGTSLGFKQAGFKIKAAIDWDDHSLRTFAANFPSAVIINKDVREIGKKELFELKNDKDSVEQVLIGCAPCQPFSKVARDKDESDYRKSLIAEFSRIVGILKPKAIFLENVPGMQNIESRSSPFHKFVKSIEREGYSWDAAVIKCTDYGVPQSRTRLVLVAGLGQDVRLLRRTHRNKKELTVKHWISDLPKIERGETCKFISNHSAAMLSELNYARISSLAPEQNRRHLPEALRLACHATHDGHSDVYSRLRWEHPASAITTRCISFSNGRFGHPEQNRAISAREAARLQTFPDSFAFHGGLTSCAKQIGNAVPPRMAKFIARDLKKQLINE